MFRARRRCFLMPLSIHYRARLKCPSATLEWILATVKFLQVSAGNFCGVSPSLSSWITVVAQRSFLNVIPIVTVKTFWWSGAFLLLLCRPCGRAQAFTFGELILPCALPHDYSRLKLDLGRMELYMSWGSLNDIETFGTWESFYQRKESNSS